jgi:hypothetical protein
VRGNVFSRQEISKNELKADVHRKMLDESVENYELFRLVPI